MEKKNQRVAMTRVSTRIRPDQDAYIKKMAKKKNLTQGEVFRDVIDEVMNKK